MVIRLLKSIDPESPTRLADFIAACYFDLDGFITNKKHVLLIMKSLITEDLETSAVMLFQTGLFTKIEITHTLELDNTVASRLNFAHLASEIVSPIGGPIPEFINELLVQPVLKIISIDNTITYVFTDRYKMPQPQIGAFALPTKNTNYVVSFNRELFCRYSVRLARENIINTINDLKIKFVSEDKLDMIKAFVALYSTTVEDIETIIDGGVIKISTIDEKIQVQAIYQHKFPQLY